MSQERFDMTTKAIRERYESWREVCGNNHSAVAADFWRDVGALLARLDSYDEELAQSLLSLQEKLKAAESRLSAVRGWLDSYGEDVGGVRSGELLRILDGAVERREHKLVAGGDLPTCDAHEYYGFPPCPDCKT